MTTVAIARYIKLLKDVDKDIKIVSSLTDVYVKKYPEITIDITKEYINRLIGIEISTDKISQILTSLGFKVTVNQDNMKVIVPSYRATKDVGIKADLVEEVARIYGYDNIEPKTTMGPLKIVRQEKEQTVDYIIKDVLSQKYGLSEVHSYVWYDKKLNKELKIETEDNIKTINSLNADNNVLRASMIPTLINMLYKNIKNYSDVNIFEIGKVWEYHFDGKEAIEYKNLGIVLASKTESEETLLLKGKEIVTNIFRLTKNILPTIEDDTEKKYSWINPINSGVIKYNGVELGNISSLNIKIKDAIDKKLNSVIIEIQLDKLNSINKKEKVFEDISKYQTVTLDLSLIVDSNLKYSQIEQYISSCDVKNMNSYSLVDIFEDKEKLGDKKSVTIKFTFGANDHTLTGEEIEQAKDTLISHFERNGAIIRK